MIKPLSVLKYKNVDVYKSGMIGWCNDSPLKSSRNKSLLERSASSNKNIKRLEEMPKWEATLTIRMNTLLQDDHILYLYPKPFKIKAVCNF